MRPLNIVRPAGGGGVVAEEGFCRRLSEEKPAVTRDTVYWDQCQVACDKTPSDSAQCSTPEARRALARSLAVFHYEELV